MHKRIRAILTALLVTSLVTQPFTSLVPKVKAATITPPTWATLEQRTDSNSKLPTAYLNFSTYIPQSDIFFTEDFEGKYLDFTQGNQNYSGINTWAGGWYYDGKGDPWTGCPPQWETLIIRNGFGINGSSGMRLHDTYGHGTHYNVTKESGLTIDNNSINNSSAIIVDYKPVKVNKNTIISITAKGSGTAQVGAIYEVNGNSEAHPNHLTYAETLTAAEFESAILNHRPIRINNPEGYITGDIWTASRVTPSNGRDYDFIFFNSYVTKHADGQWYLTPFAKGQRDHYPCRKPGQPVVPPGAKTVHAIKPGDPVMMASSSPSFGRDFILNNLTEFTPVSLNVTTPGDQIYNSYYFHVGGISSTDLYIDDVQMAYAQKVEISRKKENGQYEILPLNDPYTVEFTDTTCKDTAPPTAPTLDKATINENNGYLNLSWGAVNDNGTPYTYRLRSFDSSDNPSGYSGEKSLTITSGIKEYQILSGGQVVSTVTPNSNSNNKYAAFLPPSSHNDLSIIAVDYAGNKSAPCKVPDTEIIAINNNLPAKEVSKYTKFTFDLVTKTSVETNFGKMNLGVTWNTSGYDSTKDTCTLVGNIELINNMRVKSGVDPKVYQPYTFKDVIVDSANNITNFPTDPNTLKAISTLYKLPVNLSQPDLTKAQVKVNDSTIETSIAWQTTDTNPNYNMLGTYTIEGKLQDTSNVQFTNNAKPKMNIVVNPTDTTGVVSPTEIYTVNTYDSFETLKAKLPSSLDVSFDNGEVLSCKVNWSEIGYNSRDLNCVDNISTVEGTIEVPTTIDNAYLNTQAITPIAHYKVTKAKLHTDNISYDTSNLSPDGNLEVGCGTDPGDINLPTHITIKNPVTGEDVQVEIEVDTSNLDTMDPTVQKLPITIKNPDPLLDFTDVELKPVSVKPIPSTISSIDQSVLSYTGYLGDGVDKLGLPDKVNAMLSTGKQITLDVDWTEAKQVYDCSEPSQTLKGKIINLPNYVDNSEATREIPFEVTLNPVTGDAEKAKELIAVKTVPSVSIGLGADISNVPLPYTVTGYLANGEKIKIPTTHWDTSKVDTFTEGAYPTNASLLPGAYNNPRGLQAKIEVKVIPVGDNDIREVITVPKEISSQDPPITLPTETTAILGNGDVVKVPVNFGNLIFSPDGKVPGVYIEEGSVSERNPLNLPAIQEIDLVDLNVVNPEVIRVINPPTVKDIVGTSYSNLKISPATKVQLSDYTWTTCSTTLDSSSYSSSTTSTQFLPGQLIQVRDFTNPLHLGAIQTVKLYPADEWLKAGEASEGIGKIVVEPYVTVPYNTPIEKVSVPSTLVQLNNGLIVARDIDYPFSTYNKKLVAEQKFTKQITDKLKSTCTIKVLPDRLDPTGERTILEIYPPKEIQAQPHKLLDKSSLPPTVKCKFRDGSIKDVPVEWDYASHSITKNEVIKGKLKLPADMYIVCENKTSLVITKIKKASTDDTDSQSHSSTSTSEPTDNTASPELEQGDVNESGGGTEDDSILKAQMEAARKLKELKHKVLVECTLNIPYTLPYNTVIDWKEIYNNEYVSISPDRFEDTSLVQVKCSTSDESKTQSAMVVQIIETTSKEFIDVPSNHWAYKDIKALQALGYSKGISSDKFGPKQNISVADTFAFLDRILVNHNILKMLHTRDVIDKLNLDKDHWSYYYVTSTLSKLSRSTIDKLTSGNLYDKELTRQEVACILYDLLTNQGIKQGSIPVTVFKDANTITSKTEVDYCVSNGLFYGDNNQNFNPTDKITRAELVSVLIRLDSIFKASHTIHR